jgi:hypothetical protein
VAQAQLPAGEAGAGGVAENSWDEFYAGTARSAKFFKVGVMTCKEGCCRLQWHAGRHQRMWVSDYIVHRVTSILRSLGEADGVHLPAWW